MNRIYLLLVIFLIGNTALAQYGSKQKPSCNDLVTYAKNNYDSKDSPTIITSSMLAKVEGYKINGSYFVIAYIKQNDYDFYGTPYIYCGISDERWSAFKNGGLYGSWGKSFHKYIMDYTCDCN